MAIRRSIDVKLNVKPVFVAFYHDYVYEGPCRFGKGEELTKKADMEANQKAYHQFLVDLDNYIAKQVNLLEPVYVDRNEEFQITEDMLEKMAEDMDKADLYLFGQKGRGYDVVVEFAQRYRKPIMFTENSLYTTITAAALIARGLETYPTMTWEDTVEQLKVLRVRKALQNTRILLASRGNSTISFSSTDSFLSLEQVTKTLGVRFRYVDTHELLDQTHYGAADGNYTLPGRAGLNPTDEDMRHIGEITDSLIAGAEECEMKREDVFNSVKAYYIVKKFLEHNECNAYSMPCPDMCATRRLNQEKITFCLAHSLLNEEGIPSACEYDIPALISMIVLMNFANSAPYMGNTFPTLLKDGKRINLGPHFFRANASQNIDIPALGDMKNVMLTFHSVPNRKLKGLDREPAPYAIRSFARDGGWGVTLRYDFKQDRGQTITMCRFDPACKKLFVAKGTIVGGVGYTDQNCSQGVFFTVESDKDFFMKQVAFGNHVPLVYGDYFDKIKAFGALLGLEVVTA
jgi:L-fucose isomerase-like protein